MGTREYQRKLAGFDDDVKPDGVDATGESQMQDDRSRPAKASLMKGQTVYVVDAHSLIYQVFHAMPEMTSPTGQPVGAVHGFTRDILQLLEAKRPNYLIVAFDHPGDTFRHAIYDQYKANRAAMPDDLRPQIGNIQRMLSALGVLTLSVESYEADDILATLADQVHQAGGQCYVVTGDKDCRQLITDRVFVYNIRKDQVYDAAALMNEWGVRPDQVVDFQALVGDSVDNIPGVPLIGPKLSRELLSKYGTLEEILAHAADVPGKKRSENLRSAREQAMISRRLVRLSRDVPLDFDWNDGRVGGVDVEQVQSLCREFGFRTLAERLSNLTAKSAPSRWKANYQTIADEEKLGWLVGELSRQQRIAIDTVTTPVTPRNAEVVGYAFAWQPGEAYYVPIRAPAGDPRLDSNVAREALRPVLENTDIEKIGQNLKYDIVVLRGAGIELRGVAFDTMVAHYLLQPGERNHNIDELAHRYLNRTTIKVSDLLGTGKNQKQMDAVPVELITQYAAEAADVPLRLYEILSRQLRDEGLDRLFHELELPLIEVLAELEFNGIRVDVRRLSELSHRYAERISQLVAEIHTLAGHSFNIDSRLQLAKVLFEELGLPVVKKTKTGPSTDVDVLGQLVKLTENPLPAKIIEYRQHTKLKSTYLDALPELIHPQTGRIHTTFMQDVAATGRLSSKDPNLQNIPVRSEDGREIRAAFLPAEGWKLVAADYSQIELRVLAHFSEDEALQAAFTAGQDIHSRVASEVYEVPLDEVTSQMRRSAKAINFGIIYGQSPFGLAKALEISKEDASTFIEMYFARYPGVDKFMAKLLDECGRNGYVKTISGRRRAIQGVRPVAKRGDPRQRNLPERIAINTVIQGSAADLIKQAMIDVHRRLREQKLTARMLLQIHDELIFEAPPDELDGVASLARQTMAAVARLAVPLEVDVKVGDNWADCEPWN